MSGPNAKPRNCKHCGAAAKKYAAQCDNCYMRNRHRMRTYGRWDNNRAPLEPVREHLANLKAAGVAAARVAVLANVSRRWVWDVNSSGRRYLDKRKAAAVLAIPLPTPAELPSMVSGHALVNSAGTRRRLQALMVVGYTQQAIISRLGMPPTMGYQLWHPARANVQARTAQKVAALYDELAMTRPASTWQARRASETSLARGWAPPLAWDDATIDDPDAEPHPWRHSAQEPTDNFGEVLADYRRSGYPDHIIAAKLGIQLESLYRRLDRLGVPRFAGRAS